MRTSLGEPMYVRTSSSFASEVNPEARSRSGSTRVSRSAGHDAEAPNMNASSSSSVVRRPPVLLGDDTRFTCLSRRERVYRCDNVNCRREVTYDRKLGFNGTWYNPATRGHRFAALQSLWENGEDMRFYCVPCFMEKR